MTSLQKAATSMSLFAELSHIFCCGLPIAVGLYAINLAIYFLSGQAAGH